MTTARPCQNGSSVSRNAATAPARARHVMPERLTGRNHRIIPCLCRVTLLRVYLVHGTQHTLRRKQAGCLATAWFCIVEGHRGTDPTGLRNSCSCMRFFEKACLSGASSPRNNYLLPGPVIHPSTSPPTLHWQHITPLAPHLRIRLVMQLDQPQGSNAACGFRLLAPASPEWATRCRTVFLFFNQEKKKGGDGSVRPACVRFDATFISTRSNRKSRSIPWGTARPLR